MDNAILRLEKVTKAYRGVPAVREVDFELRKGEIHALLGENGAGKSTLTKMMAGVVAPSSGRMWLHGRETVFATPNAALEAGIAMVFQETSLVPSMTVAQNLYLGSEKVLNRLRGTYISAQQFLQSLNFPVDPAAMVGTLGAAKKQMVEIARAVHHNAEVIIFDEPTATLTPEEKRHFFALIRRLKARGVSIVFISHALEEALDLSDRITILRDGELVATGPTADFTRETIVAAMVGRTLPDALYRDRSAAGTRKAGQKVLSVQDLSMGAMVRNTSFSIFAGQVTGVFGLVARAGPRPSRWSRGSTSATSCAAGRWRSTAGRCAIPSRARRCATASSTSPRTARPRASSRRCRLPRTSIPGFWRRGTITPGMSGAPRWRRWRPSGRRP